MQRVVTSHMCGDFMGPCLHTSLDGGVTMMEALNYAKLDYVSLGNHEFDLGKAQLEARLSSYKGKLLNTNGMDDQLKTLPKYDVVDVGGKKVLMVGLCIGDPSIYSANSCPEMKDFVHSIMAAWEDACSKGQHIDIVVPMTHQLIEDDRLLAEQFEMHETMSGKAPVILGGHEHTVFEEEVADSLIVKTGQDATKIACVDIWWTAKGVKCRHVLIDTEKFTSNGPAAAWADGKKKFVQAAMEAPIMALPSKMSTKQVRFEQSDLAAFLLEKLKRGTSPVLDAGGKDTDEPVWKYGHWPRRARRFFDRVLYVICFTLLFLWATLGYFLVYIQYLPPDPTDDYCGITAFLCLWLSVFAFVDNAGEKRTWIQRWEEFVVMWVLTSGLAQIGWELPYVLWKVRWLQPIQSATLLLLEFDDKFLKPDELWAWPFWMYASGDTRYMRQHSSSHATETMLVISGPFELWAVWMLKRRLRYKTVARWRRG
ncbi:unnamed protein product [Cladocopium goreaui]|uniref:Calcineurin-like phosphoesterase domain-containing protein n=1 Tax=Cladocopium goreaui TaxID=2562237 RepID=A0A9P1GN91_9DINO|nr:unnamed protein product [Cladocopium goreaui]